MKARNDIITPELIKQYPNMNRTLRNWILWIPECEWVRDYFRGLDEGLGLLEVRELGEIINRLASEKEGEYHEAIAEIAYILLWKHLGWSFKKDPRINGKTPDFVVIPDGSKDLSFICDSTVVRHNHPHETTLIETLEDLKKPLPLETAPIQQEGRFLMKIKEKFEKYKQISIDTNAPLVIGCFLEKVEDSLFLDDFQVENALFGYETVNFTTGEFYHMPKIIDTEHGKAKVGIFAFDEYKPQTAIIVCGQESYRTSHEKLQHPKPHYPLKAKLSFDIYINPLGVWADEKKNPFPAEGHSVDGLIDIQFKTMYAQVV